MLMIFINPNEERNEERGEREEGRINTERNGTGTVFPYSYI
jgi:hypothetical protein